MAIDVTPQGNIYLCKTPLVSDYQNTLALGDNVTQYNYFRSTVVATFSNNSYIRKDRGLKINCPIDQIKTCNYLFYRNVGFTDEIYYCFITDMQYINENNTYVEIETDSWQTWMQYLVWNPCIVEREHVNDDTIGANLYPEGLEIGDDYVIQDSQMIGPDDEYPAIVWEVSTIYSDSDNSELAAKYGDNYVDHSKIPAAIYNNTVSGLYYIVQNYDKADTYDNPLDFVHCYDLAGLGNAIVGGFMCPRALLQGDVTDSPFQIHAINKKTNVSYDCHALRFINGSFTPKLVATYDTHSRKLNFGASGTYTPRNNKLFTYPYQYLYVSNNAGSAVTYKYEDFTNGGGGVLNIQKFDYYYAVSGGGGSVKLVPQARDADERFKTYSNVNLTNGISFFNDYGITGAKFPQISWNSDNYVNWLTQNGVNLQVQQNEAIMKAFSQIGTSTIDALNLSETGGLAAIAKGGIEATNTIVNDMLDRYSATETAKTTPDTAKGNLNSGDVNWAMNGNKFVIQQMAIRGEYAIVIDKYFDRFGYKVMKMKVPNVYGRKNWNFVKTLEANVSGDIPQKDLRVIRKTLNNGITFWHNASTMYNYNEDNSIV